jgi:hypothetical protein
VKHATAAQREWSSDCDLRLYCRSRCVWPMRTAEKGCAYLAAAEVHS